MYSSRRRSSYRSRSYRYRKRMNNIYAPGNSNFDLPSYHQIKGRTIQASPRTLFNPPTSIPPPDEYDQMYKKLVKAGYGPVVQKFIPQLPMLATFSNSLNDLFEYDPELQTSVRLDSEYLRGILPSMELPVLPSGYHYSCALMGLNIDHDTGTDDTSWEIIWYSSILADSPTNLVTKNITSNIQNNQYNFEAYAVPFTSSSLMITKIGFNDTDLTTTVSYENTTSDPDINRNRYPLVTSEEDDNSYLVMIRNESTNPIGDISLYIEIQIISDT